MTDLIWRDSVEVWEVPELAAQQVRRSQPPPEPADIQLADRALRDLHADGLIFIERANAFSQSETERRALSRDEFVKRLDQREHLHVETQTLTREQIETELPQWLTTRGVHKFGRLRKVNDLQRDRIGAPHALYFSKSTCLVRSMPRPSTRSSLDSSDPRR